MKMTIDEFMRDPSKALEAVERNEPVTLTRDGRDFARVVPARERRSLMDHPAFGMWADREDMADPVEYIRKLRRGRFDDL
jgi:prevent-host-death family protein